MYTGRQRTNERASYSRPVSDEKPEPLGVVLAGGASRRMGTAKALLDFEGRPLIERPLAALADAGLQAVVVAKPDSRLPRLDVEVWREPPEPRHPLCGIVAALARARGRPVVVLACDLPFVSSAVATLLARREGAVVVPRVEGRLQPLVARYEPSVLEPLKRALEREAALHTTVAGFAPVILDEAELAALGDPRHLLASVNSTRDLEWARSTAARRGA